MDKRARERGRTIIDSEFLTEIRNESMLRVAKCIRGFGFEELSMDAFEVAKAKMRRLPRKVAVIEEIKAFLGERTQKNEAILSMFQRYLELVPERGGPPHPALSPGGGEDKGEGAKVEGLTMLWSAEAEERLRRIPIPAIRRMIIQRVESHARERGLEGVDLPLYDEAVRANGAR